MPKVIGFDEKHKHKVTCENCAAIIEYTESETVRGVSYDYGGGSDSYNYIRCPNCNEVVVTK